MTDMDYQLDEEIRRAAQALPFDLERYFSFPEDTHILAVDRLVLNRARRKGIEGAVRKMADAWRGERPVREPITLRRRSDGLFDVLDGNSTVIIARAAGWPMIAATIVG